MSEGYESKTLIIYADDSYYKYYDLFSTTLYELTEKGHIAVFDRCPHSGEESLRAQFAKWDYFLIE